MIKKEGKQKEEKKETKGKQQKAVSLYHRKLEPTSQALTTPDHVDSGAIDIRHIISNLCLLV